MKPIVVLGTDTGAGKTFFSIALAKKTGLKYWKPIQTGSDDWDATRATKYLGAEKVLPPVYSFVEPLSPHLAAERENNEIFPEKIESELDRHLSSEKQFVIETTGGVLVPVTRKLLFIDLVAKWPADFILVAHDRLGGINHTLLTVEACAKRNVKLKGIFYNMHETDRGNADAVTTFTGIPSFGIYPKYHSDDVAVEKITQSLGNFMDFTFLRSPSL